VGRESEPGDMDFSFEFMLSGYPGSGPQSKRAQADSEEHTKNGPPASPAGDGITLRFKDFSNPTVYGCPDGSRAGSTLVCAHAFACAPEWSGQGHGGPPSCSEGSNAGQVNKRSIIIYI
jgi:hypothetical protein